MPRDPPRLCGRREESQRDILGPMRIYPDPARFTDLAADADVVPVWCELVGDTRTPLAAFAALREDDPHAWLFESVVGGERWGRYSFVGVGARAVFRAVIDGDAITVDGGDGQGLAGLRAWLARHRGAVVPELPPLWGGLVGVWGHDFVRVIEHLPPPPRPAPALPVLDLVASDVIIAFDDLAQRMFVIASAVPRSDGGVAAARARAADRVEGVCRRLLGSHAGELPPIALVDDGSVPVCTGDAEYPGLVRRAKQHIVAGDVFQVVLSQVFEEPRDGLDPLDIYRVLRATNPAPYMFAWQSPAATLVGASPEVLVRIDRDRSVTVRPIAGTRPRGRDAAEDAALEGELVADIKERAEHLMLIDLGRNDVGRLAAPGTVVVPQSFVVERYSKVMHLVSEVRGTLAADRDALDALVAAFPAGTLCGAPKIRALQLIDELEPVGRGWYGGAVGYLGYDGTADFAICIRAVLATEQHLRVQAGAGIVFDSDPDAEAAECRAKASAMLRAIALARLGRAAAT